MAFYIDTMEQFFEARGLIKPVYITSRTHGQVLVPCMNTLLVRTSLIVANGWNPNAVSPDKMLLLKQSILDNGFCFPVVVIWDDEQGRFVIIDGFHRDTIGGPEWLDFDYIPVVVLAHGIEKRMAATWQFNKARGTHSVELDADLIRSLIEQGVEEPDIAVRLGVDLDTIHRYKQVTGIAALFAKTDYSRSWKMVDDADPDAPK